jgi:hypothetical protein
MPLAESTEVEIIRNAKRVASSLIDSEDLAVETIQDIVYVGGSKGLAYAESANEFKARLHSLEEKQESENEHLNQSAARLRSWKRMSIV